MRVGENIKNVAESDLNGLNGGIGKVRVKVKL